MDWATINDLRDWAGVSVEEWKGFAAALGDEELNNILLVAVMPPHLFTGVLRTWTEAVGATPLRQLRMAMRLNAARLKVNVELVDLLPGPVASGTIGARTCASIVSNPTAASIATMEPHM